MGVVLALKRAVVVVSTVQTVYIVCLQDNAGLLLSADAFVWKDALLHLTTVKTVACFYMCTGGILLRLNG